MFAFFPPFYWFMFVINPQFVNKLVSIVYLFSEYVHYFSIIFPLYHSDKDKWHFFLFHVAFYFHKPLGTLHRTSFPTPITNNYNYELY